MGAGASDVVTQKTLQLVGGGRTKGAGAQLLAIQNASDVVFSCVVLGSVLLQRRYGVVVRSERCR